MKAELAQLISLQKTDTGIRRLEAELKAIPQRRADIEQQFEQRASEFRAIESLRDASIAERARLEGEIQATREAVERAERNLMKSQNEKDYAAAIREADAARKSIATMETQTLEKMEAVEKADAELAQHAPEIEKLRAEMNAQLEEFEAQIARQTEQLAALRQEHERLMRETPKQAFALYNRISTRIRDGIAVTEARAGACTACLMSLRPQVMAQVRRGDDIVMCENCNRILYYVPVDQAQSAPTT